jgi:hypothetical protein
MHQCNATFGSDRRQCNVTLQTCESQCEAQGEGDCPSGCGDGLAICSQQVASAARTCLNACTGTNRLPCLTACASAAQTGGASCALTFTNCLTGCGQGTTTTTEEVTTTTTPAQGDTTTTQEAATTTTMPGSGEPCSSGTAPQCHGFCSNPNQTCFPEPSGNCTCSGKVK